MSEQQYWCTSHEHAMTNADFKRVLLHKGTEELHMIVLDDRGISHFLASPEQSQKHIACVEAQRQKVVEEKITFVYKPDHSSTGTTDGEQDVATQQDSQVLGE